MFLFTLPGMITPTVSHLFFQLSMIKRMISGTLCNLMEFPFDYVPQSLFIGKGLIIGWISLDEMKTNFISRNNGQFSSTKHELVDIEVENPSPHPAAATAAAFMDLDPTVFIFKCLW